MVSLKIFFQELCRSRIDWDDPLPQELELKWKGVVSKFHGTVMSLPRYYFASTGKMQPCLLYGFCDASTVAYGAVVYLRNGTDSIQFVASNQGCHHCINRPSLDLSCYKSLYM